MSNMRSRARQRFLGWALVCASLCGALLGTLMLLAGMVFLLETLADGLTVQLVDLGLFFFGAAIWLVCGRAFHRGWQLLATTAAAAAISKSAANSVLLLRPFSEDERAVGGFGEMMQAKLWGNIINCENRIVPLLARIAPVIAIGKPDDVRTPKGAFREYVVDNRWRKRFFELTASAQLVVWMAGTSREVIWEFEQLLRHNRPSQLVIVLPYIGMQPKVRQTHWKALCDAVNPLLLHALPERVGKALVVVFNKQWAPALIEPKAGRLERALNPVAWPRVERALEYALSQLGHEFFVQKKMRHVLKKYVGAPCVFWGYSGMIVGGCIFVMYVILQDELGFMEWGFLIWFCLILCGFFVACVSISRSSS